VIEDPIGSYGAIHLENTVDLDSPSFSPTMYVIPLMGLNGKDWPFQNDRGKNTEKEHLYGVFTDESRTYMHLAFFWPMPNQSEQLLRAP